MLTEQAEQLNDEEKTAIASALEELRTTLNDENASTEDLRAKMDAVVSASQSLAQRLYQQQAEQAEQATAASDEGASDEDVVEAEIIDEGDES